MERQQYDTILQDLEDNIALVNSQTDNPIFLSEQAIILILDTLSILKQHILTHKFNTLQEEIYFFKKIKPRISAKLIYHKAIFNIETKKPKGGNRVVRKYYNSELRKLKIYFDNNIEFYKYYRTDNTLLDHHYFIRGKQDIRLNLDTYYFEIDHQFATSHDYKVAEIIAHDRLQIYLENQLTNLNARNTLATAPGKTIPALHWTAPKVALIELIYALHSQGVFNNGTADLKDIADHLQRTFNLDLGQYRRTFLEIRSRKSERTRFLNGLIQSLITRMDDTDQ
ncbi:RteC domain-containing protein [Elizabethkingia meningoseptica]|uniref:RteC domain-containing protein n=1 Tax=Elizabethkingia meningoseptica TaxID=238 RepID=UPI0020135FA8|nr:RteC domain-containing protein [Elizabethkingia meningoseptica]MCL1674308.1 RteC domain-containing protein [Elizabethkingia meningoseptica]MCL1686071.1 RteC domain-containing protein [Elizabethkingia meningoseptica]